MRCGIRYIAIIFIYLLISFTTGYSQPVVDGDLSDPQYQVLATKQNNNAGFGPDIDVTSIVYYPDDANGVLYVGVTGKVDTFSSDGIGLWLNFDGTGAPSGEPISSPLGLPGTGHYISGDGGSMYMNFAADFEVDYLFALTPGGQPTSPSSSVFLDGASHVGTGISEYHGSTDQNGTPYTDPDNIFGNNGTLTYAFNNDGEVDKGLEIAFDYSGLGISTGQCMEAFTFVVSTTAFFSNVTVPGTISGINPGFDLNFQTYGNGTGPFHCDCADLLPIDLLYFSAEKEGNTVRLDWRTATEEQNEYFAIERSADGRKFRKIGLLPGAGNSTQPRDYSFQDEAPLSGLNYYRLRQTDLDGGYSFSPVEVVQFSETEERRFRLSPTLARSFIRIEANALFRPGEELQIFDLTGRLWQSLSLPNGQNQLQIDISNLPAGMYFIRIGKQVEKMWKE